METQIFTELGFTGLFDRSSLRGTKQSTFSLKIASCLAMTKDLKKCATDVKPMAQANNRGIIFFYRVKE